MYAVVPYLCIALMLGLLQRSLIYHPTCETVIHPEDSGLPAGAVHTVTVKTDDGLELRGWHVLADGYQARTREECNRQLASGQWLVLYFHGNAGNRMLRVDDCRDFTRLGMNVFLFDYRGYGDNSGSPSETALLADARTIWRYATADRHVEPRHILIYGESLGGGVAVRLAAELCREQTLPGGLILNSTFSSLTDAASWHYPWFPVRLMLRDRFPSVEHIPSVRCPILQIHGAKDRIVPLELGHRLFAAATDTSSNGIEKQFIVLPMAGHNDIPVDSFQEAIRGLLASCEGGR